MRHNGKTQNHCIIRAVLSGIISLSYAYFIESHAPIQLQRRMIRGPNLQKHGIGVMPPCDVDEMTEQPVSETLTVIFPPNT